jgi:putative sigma-54 modulation protein
MALDVEVFGRNIEVTDRIFDYVTKKVSKLDRYMSGIEDARVDLAFVKSARSITDRNVTQITVRGKGFILRVEERAEDIYTAVDAAVEKMQRQMERYKGKHYKGRGDGKTASDVAMEAVEAEAIEREEEEEISIVRRKKFTLTPMDEAEALEQMALLGHENFFVFYNGSTNAVNVLYRRRDGAFGLIETELA